MLTDLTHIVRDMIIMIIDTSTCLPDAAHYCFSETFSASCNGSNQVVLMRTASYGRMQAGRCISGQFGYVGCSTTVLSFLDRLCSGQRRCETPVAGLDRLANACSADFKSYLEADYDCVEGDNTVKISMPYMNTSQSSYDPVALGIRDKCVLACMRACVRACLRACVVL